MRQNLSGKHDKKIGSHGLPINSPNVSHFRIKFRGADSERQAIAHACTHILCKALFKGNPGAIRVGIAHAAGGIAHAIGGIEQLLLHGPGSVSGVAAMLDDRRSELIRDVREDAVLLLLGRSAFDTLRGDATPIGRKLFAAIDAQLVRDLRRLSRLLGRLHGEQG